MFEKQAKELCDALRDMAKSDFSIDNFESYLSRHFDVWMSKYANTPDGLANEFRTFANITE